MDAPGGAGDKRGRNNGAGGSNGAPDAKRAAGNNALAAAAAATAAAVGAKRGRNNTNSNNGPAAPASFADLVDAVRRGDAAAMAAIRNTLSTWGDVRALFRQRDAEGNTLMHVAAEADAPADVFIALDEADVSRTARNGRGDAPLHVALRAGSARAAENLIGDRDDDSFKLRDVQGRTALVMALRLDRAPAFEALFDHWLLDTDLNADEAMEQPVVAGQTLLEHAARYDAVGCLEYLLTLVDPLGPTAASGAKRVWESAFQHGSLRAAGVLLKSFIADAETVAQATPRLLATHEGRRFLEALSEDAKQPADVRDAAASAVRAAREHAGRAITRGVGRPFLERYYQPGGPGFQAARRNFARAALAGEDEAGTERVLAARTGANGENAAWRNAAQDRRWELQGYAFEHDGGGARRRRQRQPRRRATKRRARRSRRSRRA